MMKYEMIALDVDGTLLNSQLNLTSATCEAIHRAAQAGKQIVISTGRCLTEIDEILKELPEIRYLVCENGSCVYDCKYDQTIFVNPVPTEEILYILDLLKGENVVLQCFHENQTYFNQPNGDWSQRFRVGNYRQVFDRTSVWDARLFDSYARRPFRIEKINLYFDNVRARDRIHAILAERDLKLADSIGYMIEVVNGAADKGAGLRELCRHLGLSVEETIAVGDSPNDLEILRTAGLSAAMGNAWPEAKAAADVITDDCDHDGVAKVIYEYLLEDE